MSSNSNGPEAPRTKPPVRMAGVAYHEQIASALREERADAGELARARVEKRLLEAANEREVTRAKRGRAPAMIAGVSVTLAAAAALIVWVAPFARTDLGTASRVADVRGTAPLEIRYGGARLHVAAGSRSRIVDGDADAVEHILDLGSVRVEFHPERPGEQSMRVTTPHAWVDVVGTVFEVHVGPSDTKVSVREGIVRVTERFGGQRVHRVTAGEEVSVEATGLSIARGPEVDRAKRAGTVELAELEKTDEPSIADVGKPEPTRTEPKAGPDDAAVLQSKFERAELLQSQKRFGESRRILYGVTRQKKPRLQMARAWTLIAEAWAAEAQYTQAAEAYLRAAKSGRGTLEGQNAIFARARMQHRRVKNLSGARADYEWYLRAAPQGMHNKLAERALCEIARTGGDGDATGADQYCTNEP